jgi:hypothetical protein
MSSESLASIKPAHPFFASGYFDQDENNLSDGSLVFLDTNTSQQQPSQHQHQQHSQHQSRFGQSAPVASATRQPSVSPSSGGGGGGGTGSIKHPPRDRVSSLDSAGSSGSLHYVGPKLSQAQQQLQQVQQPSVPQILPYHVRRKLMQERRQQQQQNLQYHQQQQHSQYHRQQHSALPIDPSKLQQHPPSGYPPGPLPYPADLRGFLYPGHPPPHPVTAGSTGPHPYFAPYHHPSLQQHPQHPSGYPHGMAQPPYPHPSPQAHLALSPQKARQYDSGGHVPEVWVPFLSGQPTSSTARSLVPEAAMSNRPPLRGQGQQPVMQASRQPPQIHVAAQPQRAMYQVPRPPQFPHRPASMSSSSLDSSGGDDPRGGASGQKKKDAPPPPPPPPLPAAHVRGDSAGSVSSLGSLDRSSAGLDHGHRDLSDSARHGAGLFQRLNPWSTAPTVDFYGGHEDPIASRSSRDYRRTRQAQPFGTIQGRQGPAPRGSDSRARCVS